MQETVMLIMVTLAICLLVAIILIADILSGLQIPVSAFPFVKIVTEER